MIAVFSVALMGCSGLVSCARKSIAVGADNRVTRQLPTIEVPTVKKTPAVGLKSGGVSKNGTRESQFTIRPTR